MNLQQTKSRKLKLNRRSSQSTTMTQRDSTTKKGECAISFSSMCSVQVQCGANFAFFVSRNALFIGRPQKSKNAVALWGHDEQRMPCSIVTSCPRGRAEESRAKILDPNRISMHADYEIMNPNDVAFYEIWDKGWKEQRDGVFTSQFI